MRLLYGTTTAAVVRVTEQFFGSRYYLFLAESFNAWPQNPPSSNPFQLFLDYAEIVRTVDRKNAKYTAYIRSLRRHIRRRLAGTPALGDTLGLL